jgi:hypothetical protein
MKSFFMLLLMLIIPFLAMIGIFNLGSHIIAPPNINGEWINNKDLSSTGSCKNSSLTSLLISQSGKFLSLDFYGDSNFLLKGTLSKDGEITINNENINLNLVNENELFGQMILPGCEEPILIQLTRRIS